jgi:GNAT superfamily N-acetyltransferase
MPATFQLATLADLDQLLIFNREFCELDQHPFDEQTLRPALDRLLRDEALGRVWLILDGAQAVGYLVLAFGYSLEYRGRDAFVDEIYLRASHRRQGIGTQAFAFLEQACAALGVRALHLEVEHRNLAAQQFYRAIGFRDQDRYLMTRLIEDHETTKTPRHQED